VDTLTLNSFAKVNLYLQVLRKRKDNYHTISTLFERIDLHDTIHLAARPDRTLRIISESKDIPHDATNLAYRSARLLQDTFCVQKGADIKIIKRIPVGSGMGGGSSNAACVLAGLNRLWKLHLGRKALLALAKKLGADVPFFIYDTPFAYAGGVGEKIKPLPALGKVRLWHVVAVPRIHVSTPLIYQAWDELVMKKKVKLTRRKNSVKLLTLALKKKDISLIGKSLFNALEPVTVSKYPYVRTVRERLAQQGLAAILMSGSGPTVYALVSSRKEALSVYAQLKAESHWQVFVTRTC